jgi:DNA polymerase III subunit gamma/tau
VLSLELRYRPQTFAEVIGQDHVVVALRRQIARRDQRGFLFTGETGTGKTTLASITARAYRCENPHDGEPCTICDTCKLFEIRRESGFTAFEPRPRVADVDDALDLSGMGLLAGGYRVFFFDECHLLHDRIWSRLLIELENPRKRIFIFATTHPELLSKPIRDRLTEYNLKLLNAEARITLLRRVCDREGIGFDSDGLELLARLSAGHARRLLAYLDKVIDVGATSSNVRRAFGLDDVGSYALLLKKLLAGTLSEAVHEGKQIEVSPDIRATRLRTFVSELYESEVLRQFRPGMEMIGIPDGLRAELVADITHRALALDLSVGSLVSGILTELETAAEKRDEPWFTNKLLHLNALLHPDVTAQAPRSVRSSNQPSKRKPLRLSGTSQTSANYLSKYKIASTVEAASFLPQVYGRLFNGRLIFLHDRLGFDQIDGAQLVSDCVHEIGMCIKRWSGRSDQFHYIYQHQLSPQLGFNTTLLVSVPAGTETKLDRWLREKFLAGSQAGCTGKAGVRLHLGMPTSAAAGLARHWRYVRALLRNMDPMLSVALKGEKRQLLDLLQINRRIREPLGAFDVAHPMRMSQSINEKTRRKMLPEPISAFRDGAWSFLTSGWELQEHQDRLRFCEELDAKRAFLNRGDAPDQPLSRRLRELQLEALDAEASGNPRQRKRTWTPWWILA